MNDLLSGEIRNVCSERDKAIRGVNNLRDQITTLQDKLKKEQAIREEIQGKAKEQVQKINEENADLRGKLNKEIHE